MNVPTGSQVERGREVPEIDAQNYLESLMDKDFTGYSAVTIHGETGLEEGLIIYHDGEIIGSEYLYFQYNKTYSSEEGLERNLNALKSRNGVIDTYKLSSHQLQLVKTLNEEEMLSESIDEEKLEVPESFSLKYEEKLIEKKTRELTREQLLRKYGLTALSSNQDTAGQLVQRAREEHRTLEDFLKREG